MREKEKMRQSKKLHDGGLSGALALTLCEVGAVGDFGANPNMICLLSEGDAVLRTDYLRGRAVATDRSHFSSVQERDNGGLDQSDDGGGRILDVF